MAALSSDTKPLLSNARSLRAEDFQGYRSEVVHAFQNYEINIFEYPKLDLNLRDIFGKIKVECLTSLVMRLEAPDYTGVALKVRTLQQRLFILSVMTTPLSNTEAIYSFYALNDKGTAYEHSDRDCLAGTINFHVAIRSLTDFLSGKSGTIAKEIENPVLDWETVNDDEVDHLLKS